MVTLKNRLELARGMKEEYGDIIEKNIEFTIKHYDLPEEVEVPLLAFSLVLLGNLLENGKIILRKQDFIKRKGVKNG